MDKIGREKRRYLAKWRQSSAALSACIGSYLSGAVCCWTSPAYDPVVNQSIFGFSVSDAEFAYVGSIMPLGAVVTCALAGILVDRFGCKNYLLAMSIPYVISWSMVIWPTSVNILYLGRFLGGVSGGSFCAILSVYITEIAEKNIRGTLSSFYSLLCIGGTFHVYLIGALVPLKTLSLSLLVISVIFGVWFYFQPESPVYYIRRGDEKRAKEILRYFRGPDWDIEMEFQEIVDRETTRKSNPNVWDQFKRPPVQRAVTICFILQITQQLSGIEALYFYQQWILEHASGYFSADVGSVVIGAMHLIFTVIATIYVDHLGRQLLLVISASIVALCCFVLAAFYSLDPATSQAYNLMPVLALTTFRSVYALGFGPMPWVIAGEILNEETKNLMAPMTGVVGWAMVAVTTFAFPWAVEFWGMAVTFLCFGLGSGIAVVFTWYYVPETKRKTLGEIQAMFEDGRGKGGFRLPRL